MNEPDRKSTRLTDEDIHRAVMERLDKMTRKQRVQSLIQAGILTAERKLAKPYATAPSLSYREPLPEPR
ncbi:MAG: hypothetical protein GXP55_18160 [Deltaproteobacteria bacterium]|nr:hypothetical protein [Deltaproteobacteria bacterium]